MYIQKCSGELVQYITNRSCVGCNMYIKTTKDYIIKIECMYVHVQNTDIQVQLRTVNSVHVMHSKGKSREFPRIE